MNEMILHADEGRVRISRHIYGHFAEHLGRCIYEGLWVGRDSPIPNTRGIRNDAIDALRKLCMPNLRWPGGCFADTYHWRDGIGPREARPSMVNVHWGGTTENNHFGTHEFLDLCEQLGCQPYICGNVGSGTVREMAEWLEYISMPGKSPLSDLRRANGRDEPWDITWWAVGNENWGCGGNMTAQQYAQEYRRYQGYCRHLGGGKLYKVACGFDDAWNEVLMRDAGALMDGLSVHYYTFAESWERKGPATGFPVGDWQGCMKNALGIEGFINRTRAIMDRYDPGKRVGMIVDEWGTWHTAEPGTNPGFLYQQNTIRDAIVAGVTLNIFHRHADRIHMANIAQLVNVLQAPILTDGERMLRTPTYHVFEMYRVHQDATYLPAFWVEEDGDLNASASRDGAGRIHISLCNFHHTEGSEIGIHIRGEEKRSVSGRILTAPEMDSHNTFENPDTVVPRVFSDAKLSADRLVVKLPARCVVVLALS